MHANWRECSSGISGGRRMKPCFNCGTYDGKNKDGNTISLQSTKFGSICGACIEEVARYLYAKKKGGL